MSNAPALSVAALGKRFGAKVAVDRIDLTVDDGELFCLLGPSGCGKTTFLRAIGGYVDHDEGSVRVGGRDLGGVPLERRNIGMVFQNYALFPHMSALQNVAFGLAARGVDSRLREQKTRAMLERVGLESSVWQRKVPSLSGGEQQRVAIARALVIEPRLLLLDEPMASLDRRLREAMRAELQSLQRRTGVATILVTHDQEDALFLADRIGVMTGGRLLQSGTADELYNRPRTPFVARFVGDANLLQTTRSATGGFMMVRPEHLEVSASPRAGSEACSVESITFLGADRQIALRTPSGQRLIARGRPETLPLLSTGDRAFAHVAAGSGWLIPDADPPGTPAVVESALRESASSEQPLLFTSARHA